MHLAYRVLGADFPTSVDKENANYQQNLRYQTYEDNKSDINALRKKKKKNKEKEKRKKKGKMPLTCNAACTSPENIVGFFPGKPIDF